MRFGVQLFGVCAAWTEGAEALPGLLRAAGCSLAEPCLALEPLGGLEKEIWPAGDFAARLERLCAAGLEVRSCHVFGDPAGNAGTLRELAARFGIRHFVVKSPRELTETSLQQAALNYMRAADALEGSGARLALHNEAEDMAACLGGRTAYEYLLDLCLDKVDAQVDVGWALCAGVDPAALLWRNRRRVCSLHLKDFVRDGESWRECVPGEGALALGACVQFARANGVPMIADMDSFPGGPAADLAAIRDRLAMLSQYREGSVSYLNILDTETGEVRTIRRFDRVIEAPNWLDRQGRLLYNAEGRIWTIGLDGEEERLVDTGFCTGCNNDHVIAPGEERFAVSHGGAEEGAFVSRIYTIPIGGGEPALVTPNTPSFLHGWSPDGRELCYCAFRQQEGRLEVDVYAIDAQGGEERRLTSGGFNDGPEYSPDGNYIWYNSTRSGLMQIWRMRADGSEQTQITRNGRNNWFAHVSPDGKKVVYLSYAAGELEPNEHLPNMRVEIWIMDAEGGGQRRLLSFFGGQGSLNVNSWCGDSRHLAFVSYDLPRP